MNYLLIFIAYLLGSIPFGVIVGKSKGINIREFGSGNIGATNALRTMGKVPGLIVLLGDCLKGTFAVLLIRFFELGEFWEATAGLAAIIGHMTSIFLTFKGGKGVATGFGVYLAINPITGSILLLIWLTTAFITRYSSLAAVVTYVCLPLVVFTMDYSAVKFVISLIVGIMIVLKHKNNIQRIISGKETKIGNRVRHGHS